jgi:phosphoribosyl 1,2-cyclic phosphodiesterase
MEITFLGTRGGIKIKSQKHLRHTITMFEFGRKRILIDTGLDWLKKIKKFDVDGILITHAHSDHVGGLKNGAPCPVYATQEVWNEIDNWPIEHKVVIKEYEMFNVGQFHIEPFAVEHSLRAPR